MKRETAIAVAALMGVFAVSAADGISVEVEDCKDTPALRIAADEFRRYHAIVTGREACGDRRILLKLDPAISPDGLDAYSIKSDDRGAVLAGDKPRCILYAVYDLLERRAGCRWYWDGDVTPKRNDIDLTGLDVREKSQFEWRATRYFAHRGLKRFCAEMWGPDDWRREIDWLLKNRLNLFFFRLGTDDLFQKAFPESCPYPDASKPLKGQGEGYENRSLFWSLEYRGRLRKLITDYAFERGLMIPPDFGTITHWYTRTPEEFLENVKPDFLPEIRKGTVGGYAATDSGRIWDVRQNRWVEAYWKLTEAEIANYGRKSGPLHTMGFSERELYTNKAENVAFKKSMTARMIDRALKSYPDAKILFAAWDFHGSSWSTEALKEYWKTLDWNHVVLWDYNYMGRKLGRSSDYTNWGVVGKYPYTFGTFFFHAASTIHTDYDYLMDIRRAAENDPMCKGNILWPESSHTDPLELYHFTENVWRFSRRPISDILADYCRDRYGEQAKMLESVWLRTIPLSIKCAVYGPWGGTYGRMVVDRLAGMLNGFPARRIAPRINQRKFFGARRYPLSEFADAEGIFRDLAQIDWEGEFVRRDTMDIARTLGDRMALAAISETQNAYLDWAEGKRDDAQAILADADRAIVLAELMARLLALHEDFSLWDTYRSTDAIESIRLPGFDRILFENAVNAYCASHQAEGAEHAYLPMMRVWRRLLAEKFASGNRKADIDPVPLRDVLDKAWGRDLETMRPKSQRTCDEFRRTMLDWARVAKEYCSKKGGVR